MQSGYHIPKDRYNLVVNLSNFLKVPFSPLNEYNKIVFSNITDALFPFVCNEPSEPKNLSYFNLFSFQITYIYSLKNGKKT